jgi:hypothetical protein
MAAITRSWWLNNIQFNKVEKIASPKMHPSAVAARAARSRWVMAASTSEYIPNMTKINEPEIPGRIIAQIAMAPAAKNTHKG